MKICVKSYGGFAGWILHKYFSRYLIGIWLWILQMVRKKNTEKYTNWFNRQSEFPIFQMVEIETINRCNGTCVFCPASVGNEIRPFKKMKMDTFKKIVRELSEMKYGGEVLLEVNNEPLIDNRLPNLAKILKENVPGCRLSIITNGTLLTVEKMKILYKYIDRIVVNNYSRKFRLNDNIKTVYRYAVKHSSEYSGRELEIRRRYVGEVLTNRAGSAPNHHKVSFNVTMPCLYPFVGITIFPDGRVGLCSNDCFEVTEFGNVNDESLIEIWRGDKLQVVRGQIAKGRKNYKLCSLCDVIGLGTREKMVLNGDK